MFKVNNKKLASELESNLRNTMGLDRKLQKVACLFQHWENSFVSFDLSNNFGAIDVKVKGSVLEEKSSFKEV